MYFYSHHTWWWWQWQRQRRWLEKQQLEIKMWFDSYQLLCIITYHGCYAKIGSYCCCRCSCGSYCCRCCCRSLLLGCINWPQPADLPKCICIVADNRNMHFEIVSTPVVKSDCGRPTIPKMKLNTKLSPRRRHHHHHHCRSIRGTMLPKQPWVEQKERNKRNGSTNYTSKQS